jgi:nitrite reductase/ring-hydroxylating ferredoxin subunit
MPHATSVQQRRAVSNGQPCGHVIECDRHGWQFDVRIGARLTANESVEVYRVIVEEGVIKSEVKPILDPVFESEKTFSLKRGS